VLPVTLFLLTPYLWIWGLESYNRVNNQLGIYLLVIILGGSILHELIHGLTWSFFLKRGFKAIKFGFMWKAIAPYCHCKDPIKVRYYRLGIIMPLLVLGIVPLILAIISGSGYLVIFGGFFTLGAGGDIFAMIMLRNFDGDIWVNDHPKKMGFYVLADE